MQDHLHQVGRTAEWRRDPRPDEDDMAVDSSQVSSLHPEDHRADPLRMEKDARTAFDVKDVHRRLVDLPDNVLKQILVLPEGTHLTPGQTYLDLAAPERGEFVPGADVRAGRDNRFVAKNDVDYQTWNVLLGVDNPERTGQAGEP
jgi:hypothetical protein